MAVDQSAFVAVTPFLNDIFKFPGRVSRIEGQRNNILLYMEYQSNIFNIKYLKYINIPVELLKWASMTPS
jgi:hypothetical protein